MIMLGKGHARDGGGREVEDTEGGAGRLLLL